jgi:uncharacterized protein YndB with AHSA1/START domain
MTERFIRKTVAIDAPVETVWKILTDNTFIPQYMFGCHAETDWKPGSPLLWKGAADGKLYVKGHIVAFDPPHRIEYTVIDPNSTIADIPENYLTMIFALKSEGGNASLLEIAQGDFTTVANGEQRYKDTVGGDDFVLTGIKKVAETQAAPK